MRNNHLKFKNNTPLIRGELKRGIAFLIFIFEFFVYTPVALPFTIPERFEYELTWAGIKAGTATLEIIDAGNNTLRIISTAQSARWVSIFYTVDDRVESTLIKNENNPSPFSKGGGLSGESLFIGKPLNYRLKIREGRHRRDKEVIFKNESRKVIYIDHLNNEKLESDVPMFTLDPLSSFYYVRTLDLVVSESVYVTVFDSKKVWNVEVRVLKKETIPTSRGTVDTIVIKPLMQSEGIFYRKGDIYIWLTDDEKRIPVKLQTKVAVGSITATLVGGSY